MSSRYRNRNHNHNYNNHNNYDGNNKRNDPSFSQMSNFDVLPSTPTSSSSTTPGPPPFNMLKTPLFDPKAYDYSIHPETLRHMNQSANCFGEFLYILCKLYILHPCTQNTNLYIDTDYSYEGQNDDYGKFDTFIQKPGDKNYRYSHKTVVTRLSHSIIQTSRIPSNIGPSPSLLLDTTQTRKNEPDLQTGSPSPAYNPVNPPNHSTNNVMPQISFHPTIPKNDYVDSTWSSLNRMGFNRVTIIMLLLAIIVLYQYQLHNNLHGKADVPIYINPNTTQPNIPFDMEKFIKRYDELQKQIDKNKRDIATNKAIPIDEMKNRLDQVEEKVNDQKSLSEQVQQNTKDIGQVKKDAIPALENKTQEIEQTVDTMINIEDTLKTQDWFAAYNTINYIAGISAKPDIIPFRVMDDKDIDDNQAGNSNNNNDNKDKDKDKNKDRGIFETVGIGLGRLKKQITGKPKKNNIDWNEMDDHRHRYLGNNNIISPDTSSTLNPQDCLQFATKDNWIEFHLSHKIKPTNFKYIHIDKDKIDKNDWNKSPKKFTLKGKLNKNDPWEDIEILSNKEKQTMDIKDSSIDLELSPNREIEFVRIVYDTNDDAETTRLYRFRIESDSEKIAKYESAQNENDQNDQSENDQNQNAN